MRAILHADCDAFFASVELRARPGLRGRAVVVGEGVVMAATYEARARGVHGGQPERRARALCPEAIWIAPRMEAYVAASEEVMALFHATAPLVEPVSMEEAFLDVSELVSPTRTPAEIATALRRAARERLGLPVTVGVARSKLLAKMASRAAKPDGLRVVLAADEPGFLEPLAVEQLFGVGERTAAKLHAAGLRTVGEVARLGELELAAVVGRASARYLHAAANGRDLGPVTPPGPRQSFGAQRALRAGTWTPAGADALLAETVARAAGRMAGEGRIARTIRLHLRAEDFTHRARSRTLARATGDEAALLAVARDLLAAALPQIERDGLTAIGVSLTGLEEADAAQLALIP